MIPGKKYKLEEYLAIVWRRKWLLVLPLIVAGAGTFVWSKRLPDRYRSEARILIVPQRVPESYVRTTVTSDLEERLQAISQQILSRTTLERIVQEFNLYAEERKTMIMQDVIDTMRVRDVGVAVPKARTKREDVGYFTVSYESNSPRTAFQVTERLASLFIKENLEVRGVLADATNQFLQRQLEEARSRLIQHEKKLEIFRRGNAGSLPSDVQSNLQVMNSTQVQLQGLSDSMNRDRDRQLVLDRLIADVMAIDVATPEVRDRRDNAGRAGGTAREQLDAGRSALHALELRLKPEHPDVVRARRQLAELEKRAEAEAVQAPVSPDAAPSRTLTTAEASKHKRLSDMQAERESLDRRIVTSRSEAERLQKQIAAYRTRVEGAPSREAEQTELMRDYATLQQSYTVLLTKSQEAQMAADLEHGQIGEQFRVLDGARLPERPTSPDRMRLNMMGAAAGFAFGAVLLVLFEYRDSSLRTDGDIVAALALPVLALVPNMVTREERRVRRRRGVILAVSGVAATVFLAAIIEWRFHLIARWIA